MTNWYEDLPAPRSSPPSLTVDDLSGRIQIEVAGKDFIVVDVRRTDIEVRNIAARLTPGRLWLRDISGNQPSRADLPSDATWDCSCPEDVGVGLSQLILVYRPSFFTARVAPDGVHDAQRGIRMHSMLSRSLDLERMYSREESRLFKSSILNCLCKFRAF
jgi:hypothetical protein